MQRLEYLYGKYLDGPATEAERQELFTLIGKADDHVLQTLAGTILGREPAQDTADLQAHTDRLLEAINARIGQSPQTKGQPPIKRRTLRWLPYAAAAAILLAATAAWLVTGDGWSLFGDRQLATNEILPGGNRATLTLADGRTIDLDEAQSGIIVGTENITYTDGSSLGTVMVSEVEPSLPTPDDVQVMLALTTPRGGTYQITLPDGSKVWLNAGSTLKYPSRFSGAERVVELVGEAFFEIQEIQGTRDTRAPANNYKSPTGQHLTTSAGARVSRVPFKVQTAGQTVEVLGTEFNISAYKDDPETKTTLVEGSVKVTPSTQTGLTTNDLRLTTNVLTPGQQATTRARPDESGQALTGQGAAIQIQTVNTDPYTAWKDGRFHLTGKTLPQVLAEFARWYDITVSYETDRFDETEFFGEMYRNTTLGTALKALEGSGIRFRITTQERGSNTERKLIVY